MIWAQNGVNSPARWYDLDADKNDFSVYFKQQTKISQALSLFYDLQYRAVKYNIYGFRDNPQLTIKNDYNFFNPKAGISYQKGTWSGYISYSRGQKEPNRDDFEANQNEQPRLEKLDDYELGVAKREKKYSIGFTGFYMHYKDQLVLTGKINDVGAYTRTNIPKSYRAGVELTAAAEITNWLKAAANLSVSKNKVLDFTEYLDDYDNGGQKTNFYSSADIAYSPNLVGGATVTFITCKNVNIDLISKYVGKQYLDNTQNEGRKLGAYYTQDARLIYTFSKDWLNELSIILQANNIFNAKYEPNGYTFSYYYGGSLTTENYYFPMAERNFMIGVNIKL